jgi:alpha-L-rhamnosidase
VKRLLLIVFALTLTSPSFAAMRPVNLTCEYLVNPLGIDALPPRLSWQLVSDKRDQRQSAYQILVASSEEKLRRNRGDLWDTGKVSSREQLHIEYAGKPLRSGQRCYWKVRVWDQEDRSSNYSPPANWEMGLLSPQDWHGKWIGRTTDKAYQPAPLFRRTFTVRGQIRRARIYLCGLGYHELRLNGQKVGDHLLDPGYTRYDRRVLYVTHDVTALLRQGENAVGVMLGTGWFNVHTQAVWQFHQAPWRASPRLLLELRIEYADGREERVVSDERWKCSTGPILFDSIYGGETYDARKEKPGWDTIGYSDADWQAALVVEAPKGRLAAQAMPPIKITQTLEPRKVTVPLPGVWVFDVGQNMAGHARLRVRGPAGTRLILRYGERLRPDGTLDTSHIAQHLLKTDPPQRFQTDEYILKGEEEEVWEPRFVYHGFQYVEVSGLTPEVTMKLEARVKHSAVERRGTFECSNPLLNRIQRNALWSYVSNLQSIPTDCPHREKNGWTGDAHLAAEMGLLNFDSAAVYTKWVNDLADEQRETGELPGIVPTGGWGYEWGNGPAWDSAFVLIPWYLYEYCGDIRILKTHYAGMRRYVDYLTRRAENGIVHFGLGDWVPFETQTPIEVTSTGYYYVDALIVSQAARLLGNEEDAQRYAALSAQIRKAFQDRFVDRQSGQVSNGSQTALSCALYHPELLTNAQREAARKHLLANIAARQGHIDTGILGAKYLLNALGEMGETETAYQIVNKKKLPGWGWWIEQGATTLWESWRGTDSLNHIMFGDVSAWFYKRLAGILLSAPGFKEIEIKPQIVGDLTYARAECETVRGRIVSEWRIENDDLLLKIQVPANVTATLYLPGQDPAGITEGGRRIESVKGVRYVRQERGCAVFSVGSGTYSFVSRGFRRQ